MEIEQECDRLQLCALMMDNISNQSTATNESFSKDKYFDKVLLSSYSLDFGNIVLNSNPKKRMFKLSNSGDLNLDVVFDGKAYKAAGYTITPERINKLMKG